MSRTRRHNPEKFTPKRGKNIYTADLPDDPEWEGVADGKPTHKPGKKAKAYLHKGEKAKLKQELVATDDFDNLPAPKEVKSDVWRYN